MRRKSGCAPCSSASAPCNEWPGEDSCKVSAGRLYSGREGRLHTLLQQQSGIPPWPLQRYAESLQFRLQPGPDFGPQPDLETLQEAASSWLSLFLHCEGQRLGASWATPPEYLADPRPREPRSLKNLARNVRRGSFGFEAPRQQLYLGLVALLGRADWASAAAEAWLERWRKTP